MWDEVKMMFIRKSEFERRIREAREKAGEEYWREQRFNELFHSVEKLSHRIDMLEGKILETERPTII